MKTIPVSFLIAGLLLPAVCLAQPPEPPMSQPGEEQGERGESPQSFQEAWKLADKDQDGSISKAEFGEMPRIQNLPDEKRENLFKRLDKDADGKLSRDELGKFGRPRDGKGGGPPMKRLWELDADKSGGISFDEFKAGQMFMKLPPEKQQAVFRRLDSDNDGMVTPKDRPVRPENKPHPKRGGNDRAEDGAKPDQISRKLDLNADGALSFDEFRTGPAVKNLTEDEQEDRFELLDRNKDLKISPEDFPPAATPPAN